MPCGGIHPLGWENPARDKYKCGQCGKPKPDCFVMEWDDFIHSECVPAFLETEEGKIVLEHKHEVSIWKDDKVVILHEGD